MSGADFEALKSKAESLQKRWPIYAEMIDWLLDLFPEICRAEEQVRLPQNTWDDQRLQRRLMSGKPLFEGSNFPLDMEITRNLYSILVARTEHRRGKIDGLDNMLSGPSSEAGTLLRAVLTGESETLESVCRSYGADPSLVGLLIRLSLRPSLRRVSIKAKEEFDFAVWNSGYCPVCGARPSLSELNEGERARSLYCSLCETDWAFPRLKCPFCGNNRPEDLSFVYAEEEKEIRLDICNSCGQGIGTLDAKHYPAPVIPVLDELVISHLVMAVNNRSNAVPLL